MNMIVNQLVCAICLSAALYCLIDYVQERAEKPLPSRFKTILLMLVVLAGGLLAIRLYAPPAFIHANLHGYDLLDNIYSFPQPADYRSAYGQGSFLLMGVWESLFGLQWQGLILLNSLANVGILLLAAALAYRVSGSFAAAAAIAIGALHPLFVRVAASEDAHNIGVFFGMLALYALVEFVAGNRKHIICLVLLCCTTILTLLSRQSLLFWPIMIALYLVLTNRKAVSPWRLQKKHWVLIASLVAVMGIVLLIMLNQKSERLSVVAMFSIPFSSLKLVTFIFKNHPLFRLDESLPLLLLSISGAIVALKSRQPLLLTLLAGAAISFVMTLGMSVHPGYGVEYGFRLPLFALLLPLAGAGAAFQLEALKKTSLGRIAGFVALALVLLWPLPALMQTLVESEPLQQQYEIVERARMNYSNASRALVVKNKAKESPNFDWPTSFRNPPGMSFVHERDAKESDNICYVLQDLRCFAYSLVEQTPSGEALEMFEMVMNLSPDEQARFLDGLWNDANESFSVLNQVPPSGMRRECRQAFAKAVRFDTWGVVKIPHQELPHVYYTSDEIPVGVWVMPGCE